MNIKRILCPIDFSDYNHAANDYASTLAKSTGARIIYLHAFLPDPLVMSPQYYDADAEFKRLTNKLEGFIRPAKEDVTASYIVEFGLPTDMIVKYARKNSIDLIVIGTHGHTGLSRLLMGSVAEAVVRTAECPVLAIKTDTKVLQEI